MRTAAAASRRRTPRRGHLPAARVILLLESYWPDGESGGIVQNIIQDRLRFVGASGPPVREKAVSLGSAVLENVCTHVRLGHMRNSLKSSGYLRK